MTELQFLFCANIIPPFFLFLEIDQMLKNYTRAIKLFVGKRYIGSHAL